MIANLLNCALEVRSRPSESKRVRVFVFLGDFFDRRAWHRLHDVDSGNDVFIE